MKRFYPYLADQTFENVNQQTAKESFLSTIANFINQKQYVRITLLNWAEEPLKEIQGEISSGSLTKDGSSAIRRTCSMSITFSDGQYDISNIDMDFSINKKIFIEVGIKNYTKMYKDYPILWFPQGIFFIASANIQNSASSKPTLSLSLKDKMCGLSGDVGGTFPAATILDTVDTQTSDGQYISNKVKIYDIIQELVHHYGGQPLENIVIEDVPLRIKKVVKWNGENPLYLKKEGSGDADAYYYYTASVEEQKGPDWKMYPQNTDVGYIYSDFVYTDDLTMNMGESVVAALDKIRSYLGNFEYFFDVFGVFHFREVKNYLNTTQATFLLKDMSAKNYLVDNTIGKSIYSFSDKNNIISLTNTPKFDNIKNDYVIQGFRKGTMNNQQVAVRYHLAIDNKPKAGNVFYGVLVYREANTNLIKLYFPDNVETEAALPPVGNFNIIYHIVDTNKFVFWKDDSYKEVDAITYYAGKGADANTYSGSNVNFDGYKTKDWRTELYIEGLLGKKLGRDSSMFYRNLDYNSIATDGDYGWFADIYRQSKTMKADPDYYFEELDAFWPQIYNLETQMFIGQEEDEKLYTHMLTDGNYYLDFIDPQTSGLGQYSVQNIGRRTDAVNDENVNCLFQPEIPDIIWLQADDDNIQEQRLECDNNGQPYSQLRGELFQNLSVGGYKNGAFDRVKSELWAHTTYQNAITITALPVFYLEPNSRISINDSTTNTFGDYVASSITITLGAGNSMVVNSNECVNKM